MKYIIIISLLAITIIGVIGCGKDESHQENTNTNNTHKEINEKDLNPIDKKHIVNILKAEYGQDLSINEDDVLIEGDNYIIDVYMEVWDNEAHDGHTEPHVHIQSMGIHKINMYTGELVE